MAYNKNIFTRGTVTYTDLDFSFRANPVTGDLRKKTDVEAIKQSLKNLLFTNFGERPFRPYLHGGLNNLLFEPLDQITTLELKDQILTVVGNHEPRIKITKLDVTAVDEQNSLDVSMTFNMINVLEPQTINIVLKRIR